MVDVGNVRAALGAGGQLVGCIVTVGGRRGAYPQRGGGQVARLVVLVLVVGDLAHRGLPQAVQAVIGVVGAARRAAGAEIQARAAILIVEGHQRGAALGGPDVGQVPGSVVCHAHHHPVGVAGAGALPLGVIAERGLGPAWLGQRHQFVDLVVAVADLAAPIGEAGEIAHRVVAVAQLRPSRQRLAEHAIVLVIAVARRTGGIGHAAEVAVVVIDGTHGDAASIGDFRHAVQGIVSVAGLLAFAIGVRTHPAHRVVAEGLASQRAWWRDAGLVAMRIIAVGGDAPHERLLERAVGVVAVLSELSVTTQRVVGNEHQVAKAIVGVGEVVALRVGLAGGQEGMAAVAVTVADGFVGAQVLHLGQVVIGIVTVAGLRVQWVGGLGGLVVTGKGGGGAVPQGVDDLGDPALAIPVVGGGMPVGIGDRRFLVGGVVDKAGFRVGGIGQGRDAVQGVVGEAGGLVQGIGDGGDARAAEAGHVGKGGGLAGQVGETERPGSRGVLHAASTGVGERTDDPGRAGEGGDASLGIGDGTQAVAAVAEAEMVAILVAHLRQTAPGIEGVDH